MKKTVLFFISFVLLFTGYATARKVLDHTNWNTNSFKGYVYKGMAFA
ncbi:MAG TPA: hypothetical protein VJ720_14815 [Chitinophaga sp.]|nr:hypothetical protein [Chitinophaga sp.]